MKKRIKGILAAVMVLLAGGLLFAGNYFYDQGIKRGTEVELHTESAKVNAKASESDQKIAKDADEWFQNQSLETLEITSDDGLSLKGKLFKHNENTGKAVILAHGFRQQGTDMGKYAKMYADQGYDVLFPDARGHGESDGNYIGFGWHDRLDLLKWAQLLADKFGEQTIILHGHSMGAASVLAAAGEKMPAEVKAVIADSSYSTVKEELAHQLKHIYSLPSFPLLDVTSVVTQVRAGWNFKEANILTQTSKIDRPVFFIHGDTDDLVPTDMVHELFDAANSEKELWIVPGTGHTKAFDNHTEEFEHRIHEFLEKVRTASN